MLTAVNEFTNRISSESAKGKEVVAFFYYSGHGVAMQNAGRSQNYLLPAKHAITSRMDLLSWGVNLGDIIENFAATRAKAFFVVSDACRNELGASFSKSVGTKGFSTVPQRPDMLIAFSTAPGAVAPDDGKFASYLAAQIKRPGQEAEVSFLRTLRDVSRTRNMHEQPFMTGAFSTPFCFAGCSANADESDWQRLSTAGTLASYELYLQLHPNGAHAASARAAIARLKKDSVSPTPKPDRDMKYAWNRISDDEWNKTSWHTVSKSEHFKTYKIADIQNAIDAGDVRAISVLAHLYRYGTKKDDGVPKDDEKALKFSKQACDRGELYGCHLLSTKQSHSRIEAEKKFALEKLVSGCYAGFLPSCNYYAQMFERGPEQSIPTMTMFFNRACDAGHAKSCSDLASKYHWGVTAFATFGKFALPKDANQSVHYYEKACNIGSYYFCRVLAEAYASGKLWGKTPITKDSLKARNFYKQSCDHAQNTCGSYGNYLYLGIGGPVDKAEGVAMLRKSCAANEDWSCKKLDEYGVSRN